MTQTTKNPPQRVVQSGSLARSIWRSSQSVPSAFSLAHRASLSRTDRGLASLRWSGGIGGRPRWAGCLGLSDTVDSSSGLGQIVQLAGLMHLPRALRPQRQRLPRQTREHARRIVATVHGQQRSQHVGAIEQRRRAIHAHYQAGRVMGAGARRHVDAPARLPFVVAGWHGSAVGVGRLQCGLQSSRGCSPGLIPHAVALAASVDVLAIEHEAGGCATIPAPVDESGFAGIKCRTDLICRHGIAVDEVVSALCVAHDDLLIEPPEGGVVWLGDAVQGLGALDVSGAVAQTLDDGRDGLSVSGQLGCNQGLHLGIPGGAAGVGGLNRPLGSKDSVLYRINFWQVLLSKSLLRLLNDAVALCALVNQRVEAAHVFGSVDLAVPFGLDGGQLCLEFGDVAHFESPESASFRLVSDGGDALSMGINVLRFNRAVNDYFVTRLIAHIANVLRVDGDKVGVVE